MPVTLELGQIQGMVLRGFGTHTHAAFLFLCVRDVAAARRALAVWAREVAATSSAAARSGDGDGRLQLAFSARGLRRLGLSDDDLATFPLEFQEGMAAPDRARVLGDTGTSAPATWQIGGPGDGGDGGVDVWLALYARGPERLRVALDAWRPELAAFDVLHDERTLPRDENREHFGFRDGIPQPAVEGDAQPPLPGQDVVRAGEFLFGYPNQYDRLPMAPRAGGFDLGRNGTFLVYRKLEQDVAGFWGFFREAARDDAGREQPELATYLAAKCMGRWPSGAPLALAPERDDPALGADPERNNDFRFAASDPRGLKCPIGSHIRRCNPRDAKGPRPDEALAVSARHRIIRRGRTYREASGARGVHFLCVNTNLRRQFELIQQAWVVSAKFEGLRDARDPIVGDSDGGHGAAVVIPALPFRRRLPGVPRFVQVRGGMYLFLPGVAALAWLAGYDGDGRSSG